MLSHSNSFGNDAEKDTAGCRAFYRKSIVIGGVIMGARFPEVDWYCDRCNAYLNLQPGFDDHHYVWKCTECGHKNSISADSIYESEEEFRNYSK